MRATPGHPPPPSRASRRRRSGRQTGHRIGGDGAPRRWRDGPRRAASRRHPRHPRRAPPCARRAYGGSWSAAFRRGLHRARLLRRRSLRAALPHSRNDWYSYRAQCSLVLRCNHTTATAPSGLTPRSHRGRASAAPFEATEKSYLIDDGHRRSRDYARGSTSSMLRRLAEPPLLSMTQKTQTRAPGLRPTAMNRSV